MSIVSQLLAPERRSLQGPLPLTASKIVEWLSGEATTSGIRISPEGSLRIAAVYACVRLIAEAVSSLPLITYARDGRSKGRAVNHRLYSLLHDSPNPQMPSMIFREALQGHLLLRGNAFANIERDANGDEVALWPLRPDRMQGPQLSAAGTLLYNYQTPIGPVILAQDEVLHLRGFGFDGLVGYSPITLHRETLGHAQAAAEYGGRFFGNNARPGGVLQAKGILDKDVAARLKADWAAMHQGLTNAHRVAILEEGLEWKQVGISPEDAQYLETRKFDVTEIARIFHVQPHKIADLERATFSNVEQMSIEFVTDTLRPWLVRWEQHLNMSLLRRAERGVIYVEHLVDALLRGETLARYQAYALALQWGWMNKNEVRERENFNPFDGGDEFTEPMNMAPVGQSAPAVPAPAAAVPA